MVNPSEFLKCSITYYRLSIGFKLNDGLSILKCESNLTLNRTQIDEIKPSLLSGWLSSTNIVVAMEGRSSKISLVAGFVPWPDVRYQSTQL